MPPYSVEYTNLQLALQGAWNSFTTVFHAVYATINRLHCPPLERKENQAGRKNILV